MVIIRNLLTLLFACPLLTLKVMQTPEDASVRVDGKRHESGMKIDDSAVKVYTYMYNNTCTVRACVIQSCTCAKIFSVERGRKVHSSGSRWL